MSPPNKKSDLSFINLPSDSGGDFSQERGILNYRPRIRWEEPPTEFEEGYSEEVAEDDEVREAREEVKKMIKSYDAIEKIADEVEKRVDAKAKGYAIELDPDTDAHVIDAINRQFGDDAPGNKITYDMYKKALKSLEEETVDPPSISKKDMDNARKDPSKTKFGGMGKKAGLGRDEVDSPLKTVKPLDKDSFQKEALSKLFKLMTPDIKALSMTLVRQHEVTKPHS